MSIFMAVQIPKRGKGNREEGGAAMQTLTCCGATINVLNKSTMTYLQTDSMEWMWLFNRDVATVVGSY